MLDIVRDACSPVCNVLHLLQDWKAHLVHAPAKWAAVSCQKCKMLKGRESWISWLSNACECSNWKIISRVAYSGRIQNYLYSTIFGVSSNFPTFLPFPQLSLSSAQRFTATGHYSVSPWGAQSGILFFPWNLLAFCFKNTTSLLKVMATQQSWDFFKPRNQTNGKILSAWYI